MQIFLFSLLILLSGGACVKEAIPNDSTGVEQDKPDKNGLPPGVVVARSDDPENLYVASPGLVIMPDGSYLVSHDWSGPASGGTRTSVYRSRDKGASWSRIADVKDMRWSSLFVHGNSVYLFGVKKSYGDIHIRRSNDGGVTWTNPVNHTNGVLFKGGRYHTAPVPVLVHGGRIWRAFEEQPIAGDRSSFQAFVISAPEKSDLLLAANWTKTSGVSITKEWLNAKDPAALEGNVIATPDGKVVNLLRLESHPDKNDAFALTGGATGIPRFEVAPLMEVSPDNRQLLFNPAKDFVHLPGAESKFTVRYDAASNRYWMIANKITKVHQDTNFDISPHRQRNILSLFSSPDLRTWTEHSRLIRWKEGEIMEKYSPVGFQYPDWQFEGDDIIFVSRTGWFGKRSHDANYITFHRIKNFRTITMADSSPDLGL